ncbi:MAG: hypothetical protein K2N09_04660 [Muribaculaceae bacterium]|nr:hypothetical protein [Muribaculaceae bacterium]
MKRKQLIISLLGIAAVAITALTVWGQNSGIRLKHGNEGPKDTQPKIALAYVEDYRKGVPDPYMFTHLVYSFAEFNDDCDGYVIKNPEKLQAMVNLKKQNPALKVILGIGGYKREGFSEMAGDKKKRKAYVGKIRHLVDSLGLDGVDLDWEFPTTTDGGHTASPQDKKNYVTLVKDLRKALGKDKWISYYSLPYGAFIDHKAMVPYVTYVNVSGYNVHVPKEGERAYHQSALYPSKKAGGISVSGGIAKHMELGVPKEKILMGIPFYGRGISPFPSYLDCNKFYKYSGGLKPLWDADAQVPYYADEKGNLVLGFDDERSIEAKFDFIRANGLPGVFVWNYDSDFDDHRLGKTIQRLRK